MKSELLGHPRVGLVWAKQYFKMNTEKDSLICTCTKPVNLNRICDGKYQGES